MDKWKAELLVKMRMNKITQRALAKHMNLTEEYISMIFNGAKNPKNTKDRILQAINEIIEEKNLGGNNNVKHIYNKFSTL